MGAYSEILQSHPTALSEMLMAVDFYFDAPKEVVIVSPKEQSSQLQTFLKVVAQNFVPNRVLIAVPEGEEMESLANRLPLLSGKVAQNNKTTAYVCLGGSCKLPTNDGEVFRRQILEVKPLATGLQR
jgi:uncharacterized protein YyaL (SSP411 family)